MSSPPHDPAPRPVLRLDWCSHAAAKYAVEHWHYSRRMPLGPMVHIGVWEQGRFIGAVLFARGNTPTLGQRYGLPMTQVCELVRVALDRHQTPVSRIVSVALRMLTKHCPGLRLVVSFSDPAWRHLGGIYQAGNWIYTGESTAEFQFYHDGRWKHRREITSGAFGGTRKVADYSMLPKRLMAGKHRYLYPLDAAMRAQIAPLARPYPKRLGPTGVDSDTAPDQGAEAGAHPSVGLHAHSYQWEVANGRTLSGTVPD